MSSDPNCIFCKIVEGKIPSRKVYEDEELFAEESWIQVLLGQGVMPRGYDPLVDVKDEGEIAQYLGDIERVIRKCVDVMPTHADYIAQHCAAPKM